MVYGKDSLGFFDYDWAPDGRRIVLATNRNKRPLKNPDRTELLMLDVQTGKTCHPEHAARNQSRPVFADGRWIAYAGRTGRTRATP